MASARKVAGVGSSPDSGQSGNWKVGLAAVALTGFLAGACTTPTTSVSPAKPATKAGLADRFDQIPLTFETNTGQTDPSVRMAARGRGYGLFLTPNETVLRLNPSGPDSAPWVLRMQLVGATTSPQINGEDPFAGTVNYLKGSETSSWYREVPTYAKARYQGVYPGTDMVLYGSAGQLEYDFVLAPGADPAAIAMRFDGADNLSLADNGDLIVSGGGGKVRQAAPRLYQGQGNDQTRVDGRFVLRPGNQVGFEIGQYDPSRTLVIDPVLDYSTYFGGGGTDYARDIALSGDNAYVVGSTDSLDFPVRDQIQTDRPGTDVFVSKLSGDGTRVVYSTYLGGGAEDQGLGIAVGDGSAYITGSTDSTDFPVRNGRFQGDQPGLDAFVAKLTPSGSDLSYATYLGGSGADRSMGIAVADGTAYVTGSTDSVDFPLVAAYQADQPGPDAFVAKVRGDGSGLVFSTYLGGAAGDDGLGIAVDDGDAYVTGVTDSADFPLSGPYQTDQLGTDAFVVKLSGTGSMEYATYLGGAGLDRGLAIAVDDGNAYVTGSTMSIDFPIKNRAQTNQVGLDAFVTKVSRSGSQLVYSTYLGGAGAERGMGIAVADGAAYVTGSTDSLNFPARNEFQADQPGLDAFVTKIRNDGAALVYSTQLGGIGSEEGYGVAVSGGNAYVVGATDSVNFPTKNRIQANQLGVDSFITKLTA